MQLDPLFAGSRKDRVVCEKKSSDHPSYSYSFARATFKGSPMNIRYLKESKKQTRVKNKTINSVLDCISSAHCDIHKKRFECCAINALVIS